MKVDIKDFIRDLHKNGASLIEMKQALIQAGYVKSDKEAKALIRGVLDFEDTAIAQGRPLDDFLNWAISDIIVNEIRALKSKQGKLTDAEFKRFVELCKLIGYDVYSKKRIESDFEANKDTTTRPVLKIGDIEIDLG